MQELNEAYLVRLDQIAQDLQNSELYQTFLEEEEEELYKELCSLFEGPIAGLHRDVANENPLQLVGLESTLLHPALEGLFLPRILGFSVLRGEINDQYKYKRPQQHFKNILQTICESSNFEYLKKRIGQSIQIGFALSSDIWITDFINSFANKRVRNYLVSQKNDRFRNLADRQQGYKLFERQFAGDNYLSADFPQTFGELKVQFSELKRFLVYRISKKLNNTNILGEMRKFLENEAFFNTPEYIEFLVLYANFFELLDEDRADLADALDRSRKNIEEFDEKYFGNLIDLLSLGLKTENAQDLRVSGLLDKSISDELTDYYKLLEVIHAKGYVSVEAMDAVRDFYNTHEGRSLANECVRETIYSPIHRLITNLGTADYPEYFEIHKVFSIYMQVFANEQFNKRLKEISLKYARQLVERYQDDKRGRHYQDIRKFISSQFVAMHFMSEKDVIEMFKTRRKKKED